MITTFRYGGKGEVEKNGKKSIIQIPHRVVLNLKGAFLEVTITHPPFIQEKFKQQGKSVPEIKVGALIDTGASGAVITPRVAKKLKLIQTGFRKVSSVQDEQLQPEYYDFIIFQWGSAKEVPLVSCPLKEFDCLIGRDVLQHWYFAYNGLDGSIVICD